MSKKIIIKESQYNKILLLLSENITNNLNVDDIITIIDVNDNQYEINIESIVDDSVYGKDQDGFDIIIKSIDSVNNEIKFIKNENNNQVEKILNFKNIKISKPEKNSEDVDSIGEKNNDELFKKYYHDIMNDPRLKKAFYTAPSLWNYFTAALTNKKARGTGILPAYDLINKHYNSRIEQKLPGFTDKENKRAAFYLLDTVIIRYRELNGRENELIMEPKYYKATVKQYEAGLGDVKVLTYRSSGGNFGFKLAVKKPTGDRPDEYYCDIYVNNNKVEENKYVAKNVKVKFINSDGYSSYDNLKKYR